MKKMSMVEKAGKNLTVHDLIDAFPDECEKLVPKLIKAYRGKLKPFYRDVKMMRKKGYDIPTEMILEFVIKMRHKPEIYEQRIKRLELISFTLHPPKNSDITPAIIESVKLVPINSLYEFKKVRVASNRFTACCPFHDEKTPSFFIYPNNSYYCFGCHNGGDVIEFVMQLNGLSFIKSVKYLLNVI